VTGGKQTFEKVAINWYAGKTRWQQQNWSCFSIL